jgi:hypothetical protein
MEQVWEVIRNSAQEMIVVNMPVALPLIKPMREDATSIQRKKQTEFSFLGELLQVEAIPMKGRNATAKAVAFKRDHVFVAWRRRKCTYQAPRERE